MQQGSSCLQGRLADRHHWKCSFAGLLHYAKLHLLKLLGHEGAVQLLQKSCPQRHIACCDRALQRGEVHAAASS